MYLKKFDHAGKYPSVVIMLSQNNGSETMRLFISHSSKDEQFVSLLVELLQSALSLRPTDIRCTSLDGYRLPGGVNIENQLRAEVLDSEVLIGVISPSSVESIYVAFELGARWGSQKHLIPLLAPEAPTKLLSGPLQGLNSLRANSRAQLHQLVYDLATLLKANTESPAAYGRYIEAILTSVNSSSSEAEPDKVVRQKEYPELNWPASMTLEALQDRLRRLSGSNRKILSAVAQAGDFIYIMDLEDRISIDRSELVYRGKDLANEQLIHIEHLTDFAYSLHPAVREVLGGKANRLILSMIDE